MKAFFFSIACGCFHHEVDLPRGFRLPIICVPSSKRSSICRLVTSAYLVADLWEGPSLPPPLFFGPKPRPVGPRRQKPRRGHTIFRAVPPYFLILIRHCNWLHNYYESEMENVVWSIKCDSFNVFIRKLRIFRVRPTEVETTTFRLGGGQQALNLVHMPTCLASCSGPGPLHLHVLKWFI